MAGVAEMLADYARDKGHISQVLQIQQLDPFGFGDYYQTTDYFTNWNDLISKANTMIDDVDYIILHDFIEIYKEFDEKKLFLFFHGSKLRDLYKNQPETMEIIRKFKSFVSTKDLLDILPTATYIPVPCDTQLFLEDENLDFSKWLCINRDYQKEFIEPRIREKYPKIEYRIRQKEIIKYWEMPKLLKSYGNYVDWKFDYNKPIPNSLHYPSATGIQAISCGLDVYGVDGKFPKSLLKEHEIDKVGEKFIGSFT